MKKICNLCCSVWNLSANSTGNVLCLICAADAHEHAAGVPLHRHGGSGRTAVQLLPPLVWRHLPGQRLVQHPLPLSRPQAGSREAHDSLKSSSAEGTLISGFLQIHFFLWMRSWIRNGRLLSGNFSSWLTHNKEMFLFFSSNYSVFFLFFFKIHFLLSTLEQNYYLHVRFS